MKFVLQSTVDFVNLQILAEKKYMLKLVSFSVVHRKLFISIGTRTERNSAGSIAEFNVDLFYTHSGCNVSIVKR